MPNFSPIRACIFDVDGLLINSEDIYSITMNNTLHEYGLPDIPWSIKATQQSRGRQGFANVMEWAKLPISIDEFKTKVDSQREPFQHCKLLPGVPELLHNLSTRAVPQISLALASSAERDFFKLKTDQFSNALVPIPEQHRIFGDDPCMSGCKGKPAPDIFVQALARLNDSLPPHEPRIKPAECLVFEDSTAGVQAGRKAGMRVVWVPHPGLLEVYRGGGREEKVLAGAIDEQGNVEEGSRDASESSCLPFSKDGRAELVMSLEGFPYEHYGIELA